MYACVWYVCVFAFVNRNTLLCVGEFDAERIFREFFGFNFDLGQGTCVLKLSGIHVPPLTLISTPAAKL